MGLLKLDDVLVPQPADIIGAIVAGVVGIGIGIGIVVNIDVVAVAVA